MTKQLTTAIQHRLTAGAALAVTNPDGTTNAWPVARHFRIDDDLLWLRPLMGGRRSAAGTVVFPLGDCRRRGISLDTHTVTPAGDVRFELASGQVLELRPATQDELATLELWDTFVLTVLTAEEEADLDALEADSWHGRYT